jgi:GNAT superfamily N-acetyltransferase
MIPVAPDVLLRPVQPADTEALAALLNDNLPQEPYSRAFDGDAMRDQVLHARPRTVFPVRWQRNLRLGAWRAGQLIGFLDAATGLDSHRQEEPDFRPLGLLRMLVLPRRTELQDETAHLLLDAAEDFWRRAGTRYIQAFHVSTGYPHFQGGAGMLPSHWATHFRLLTARGYALNQRYHGLVRPLAEPVAEEYSQSELRLEITGSPADRRYQLYHRRVDRVGRARVVGFVAERVAALDEQTERTDVDMRRVRVAHLLDFYIEPSWRNRDIGKWLLHRLLNDALMQGFRQMVVYLPQGRDAGWSLLIQLGFQEWNYRGYTLEKMLLE